MDIKETQNKLSKVNSDFFEFVENNPDALKASSYKMMDLNDKLFVLQPWPTFVNKAALAEFQEASVGVFDLIKSIPERMFDNDIKKISSYYEIPETLARLQMEGLTEVNLRNLLGRGDYFLTSAGLKCLEFNITANLGGLYVPAWELLCLNTPIISKFLKEYDVKIKNENLIQWILERTIQSIPREMVGDTNEKNILLVVQNYSGMSNTENYLNKFMQIALQKQNENIKGRLFVCDYHQLKIIDNHVYYKGVRIHALIELYLGLTSPEVLEVYKSGNILIFNGPITELMSNKLNLALLSDYEAAGTLFSDEEKRIIDKYIPWTRKVIPGFTTYGTEMIKLEDFILSNKDRLVIKAGIGYGGSDVHIGRGKSWLEWDKLVKKALEQRSWMVQEFVDHLSALYQAGENGCEAHDIVWGFFVMGSQYGGAWARVIPKKSNKGTINCHQGAKVSVIFEVDE